MKPLNLQFVQAEDGSFTFDTGVLKGVLRQAGKSSGLFPVTYTPDGSQIADGEGIFNHYRVFTLGKRYGYGARRWPSTTECHPDGSVEVFWKATPERPFNLTGTYNWVTPNTIDLLTVVRAESRLEAFEVFLASYYSPPFTDSQVWAMHDPRGGEQEGFVSADEELGAWLAFPRDKKSADIINDGRWDIEPHPLAWTIMPDYALPLALRRDPSSGLTMIVMAQSENCFGIFTPHGQEKHYSNYLSFFGHDIDAGERISAQSRLVVLPDPTLAEIRKLADEFRNSLAV